MPYVIPLVRGGSRVGGRAQRGPNAQRGVSLPGSGPWERAGVGGVGLALPELRLGRGGGLRGGRAGLEKAGAGESCATFTAELGPASLLPLLGPSSRRAAVSTEAAWVPAALGICWGPTKL